MKRPIGKIAALLLLPLFLFAEVKVNVDNNVLYAGDDLTYTITASGSDIEFPAITSIDRGISANNACSAHCPA